MNNATPTAKRASHEPTPRDLEVLRLFATFRLVTSEELELLTREHFPSPYVLWRRLNWLWKAGHLTRPEQQRHRFPRARGSMRHIYALGSKGADELRRAGYKLPAIDFDQKARARKPSSFDHPLLIARFLTCLLLALKKRPELTLIELLPDRAFRREVAVGTESIALEPDGVVTIRDGDGERLSIMLEADRGTEPLMRRDFRQSAFWKKARAYLGYWSDRARVEEDLGGPEFVVATVCETENRVSSLRELLREADPEKRGTDLFWFTTAAELRFEEPERLLADGIWMTAAGNRGSLF